MKLNQLGIVDKIKVLKSAPTILVRFTLTTKEDTINCLVYQKSLVNQLLFLENGQTEIACFGHVNNRKQLVIEKMMIRTPTPFLFKPATKK